MRLLLDENMSDPRLAARHNGRSNQLLRHGQFQSLQDPSRLPLRVSDAPQGPVAASVRS
jgi:hypothetical protein